MNDSKRLTVLKRITALLETITVANGYQHDLTGRIYRGRGTFGNEFDLPCVSILEALIPDREPVPVGSGVLQDDDWILLIQGWAPDDADHPTDPAHALLADLKKALARVIQDEGPNPSLDPFFRLGGLIADLRIEPGVVRPPDELSARAYCYLRVAVSLSEHLDDPYSLT